MADEYVVRIVLDGVDNASDDIERVDGNVEELGNTMATTDGQLLMFAGGTAALAAGLNQMTGGIRKSISAMRDLGYINEQTFQSWNDNILRVEIFSGVMESLAATTLAGIGATWLWKKAASSAFVQTGLAGARAIRPLGIVLVGATGFLIGMTAALLGLFVVIIFYRDELMGFVRRIGEIGEQFNLANRAIGGAADALRGFGDAVRAMPGNVIDNFTGKSKENLWGAGGSPSALA